MENMLTWLRKIEENLHKRETTVMEQELLKNTMEVKTEI